MNKQLIKLLVLVVVLAGVAVFYFWDKDNIAKQEKREADEKRIFLAASDDVQEVTLLRKDQPDLVVTKTGEGPDAAWTVKEGAFAAAADKFAVDPMIGSLVRAEKQGSIEDAADLGNYGLAEPEMVVILSASGQSPVTLDLGADAPGTQDVFVRVKGDEAVYRIRRTVKTSLDKTLFDLREKAVARVEPADIRAVELTAGGETIHLARDAQDQWRFTQPLTSLALKTDVESLIRKASNTRATAFIDNATDLEIYGLTQTATRVTYFGKDESLRTLLVGRKDELRGGYYVKHAANPSIMVVPEDFVADTVGKSIDDLQLKNLFTFQNYECEILQATSPAGSYRLEKIDYQWHMTEPRDASCDFSTVNEMVRQIFNAKAFRLVDAVTDATVFGFEEPVLTLTCESRDGARQTVVFGAELPRESNIFARRLADHTVMVVAVDVLDALRVDPESLLPSDEPEPGFEWEGLVDEDAGWEDGEVPVVPHDLFDGLMDGGGDADADQEAGDAADVEDSDTADEGVESPDEASEVENE